MRARAVALVLAALPALAGCLDALGHAGEVPAPSPWNAVGLVYEGPSSPAERPTPSDPWSGTTWWRSRWDLYEARAEEDRRLMRAFVGNEANATVFLEYPLYLTEGRVTDPAPLERLRAVVDDLKGADFRVVLVLMHPDAAPGGRGRDPIGVPADLAEVARAMDATLAFADLARDLDAVAVDYLGGVRSHEEWQVLAYHRQLKAVADLHGLPFLVKLGRAWTNGWLWQNGYSLKSVAPASGASDGLIVEASASPGLPSALAQIVPSVVPPDKLWLLDGVANCDLNPRFGGEDHACERSKVEEDAWFFFRAASLSGATQVASRWSDGGGDRLPRFGVLRADAEGLTTKGLVFHDFLVGRHDPAPFG